jgi:hypothetical protein
MTIWTKSDAACEQLDAAIGLLCERRFIAAHTLVSAAIELSTDVARANGRKTHEMLFAEAVKISAPERLDEVQRTLRRPQNFAKHADRDHDEAIEVKPELTILRLFSALFDLGIAFERQTLRQVIFRAWFTARDPTLLLAGNEAYLAGCRAMFGDLSAESLDDALNSLREHVADLEAADIRAQFNQTMAAADIDWNASARAWDKLVEAKTDPDR